MIDEDYKVLFTVYPAKYNCIKDKMMGSRHFHSSTKELPEDVLEYMNELMSNDRISRVFIKVGINPNKDKYEARHTEVLYFKEKFYYKWPKWYTGSIHAKKDIIIGYDSSKVDFDKLFSEMKLKYMESKLKG